MKEVAFSLTLTLAMRPLGAFIFGRLADRYGRKPILMIDVVSFRCSSRTAFAPSLTVLSSCVRCSGSRWAANGASARRWSWSRFPRKPRLGVRLSAAGLCRSDYLLAAVVYLLLFDLIGWRGMFVVGMLPALLVLYIRLHVDESPAWQALTQSRPRQSMLETMRGRWKLFAYLVLLMMAFNFLSHGTQDLYPTFLQVQHEFSIRSSSASWP